MPRTLGTVPLARQLRCTLATFLATFLSRTCLLFISEQDVIDVDALNTTLGKASFATCKSHPTIL
jgi:hypothetical protein